MTFPCGLTYKHCSAVMRGLNLPPQLGRDPSGPRGLISSQAEVSDQHKQVSSHHTVDLSLSRDGASPHMTHISRSSLCSVHAPCNVSLICSDVSTDLYVTRTSSPGSSFSQIKATLSGATWTCRSRQFTGKNDPVSLPEKHSVPLVSHKASTGSPIFRSESGLCVSLPSINLVQTLKQPLQILAADHQHLPKPLHFSPLQYLPVPTISFPLNCNLTQSRAETA